MVEKITSTNSIKPLAPSEFPINFKDIRKFEAGLNHYNQLIATPKGLFASKFHLPRAAMQNIPELKRFESELINETSFFRDYSNETNRQVNDFLDNLAKSRTAWKNFDHFLPFFSKSSSNFCTSLL